MKYILSDEEIEQCKLLGMKRSGSMNHAETKNSQNFLNDKPAWYRHFIGVCGEHTYSLFSGEKVDSVTIGKGDNGFDFSNGVQVKSSDSKNKPNLMFPVSQFNRKIADTYVLVWVKLPECEIIGKISRNNVKNVCEVRDYGRGETIFVANDKLESIVK